MSQKKFVSVGIDVSKDTLAVAIRSPTKEEQLTVPNSSNGIEALRRRLGRRRCPLVMESTGRYHLLAAFLLSEKGYDVRLVNPLHAKRYINSSIRKKKTDATDAAALAQMAATDQKLPSRFALSKQDIQIRHKIGLLTSVEKHLQSFSRMVKTYVELQDSLDIKISAAEWQVIEMVRELELERARLQLEIQNLILGDAEKRKKQELACSIPGISAFTGSLLCQILNTNCTHAKQWIAFVGYDVSLAQSGNWRGKGKLSKRGNGYLRKCLFCAAWGAVMNNVCFREYYQALKKKGHSHRAAIVIIARKLLRILFSVLKEGKPFSAECCLFPA